MRMVAFICASCASFMSSMRVPDTETREHALHAIKAAVCGAYVCVRACVRLDVPIRPMPHHGNYNHFACVATCPLATDHAQQIFRGFFSPSSFLVSLDAGILAGVGMDDAMG